MAQRKLRVPTTVADDIRRLHPDQKRRVRAALEAVLLDPALGDPLQDELEGLQRVRVGRLRVVYRVSTRSIEIVGVGPRATIYAELVALLREGR